MPSTILHLSNGLSVRAIESGQGDPVLLLHGVGMRSEAWEPQIHALASRFRVVAVDLPGHGESDPLPLNALLPDFVDWAARVVGALATGPVNIVGHSMGALIASGLAIEQPALVRRLALISTVHRRSDAARRAVANRAALISAGSEDARAPLDRWFSCEQQVLRESVGTWLRDIDRKSYATAYHAFAKGDAHYADRVANIQCPVLALTGAEDINSTPQMSRSLVAEVARGEVEIIAGERHMVSLTSPGAVNAALSRWLTCAEATA